MEKSIQDRENEYCSTCGGMRNLSGEDCMDCNEDGKLKWYFTPPQKFIDSGDIIVPKFKKNK